MTRTACILFYGGHWEMQEVHVDCGLDSDIPREIIHAYKQSGEPLYIRAVLLGFLCGKPYYQQDCQPVKGSPFELTSRESV